VELDLVLRRARVSKSSRHVPRHVWRQRRDVLHSSDQAAEFLQIRHMAA
jgi:hypothetical protein